MCLYVCMSVFLCVHVCERLFVFMCVSVCVRVRVFVCLSVSVCEYVCV